MHKNLTTRAVTLHFTGYRPLINPAWNNCNISRPLSVWSRPMMFTPINTKGLHWIIHTHTPNQCKLWTKVGVSSHSPKNNCSKPCIGLVSHVHTTQSFVWTQMRPINILLKPPQTKLPSVWGKAMPPKSKTWSKVSWNKYSAHSW